MRILILMILSLVSTGVFGQFKISQVEGEVTDTEGVAVINEQSTWNELKILPKIDFRLVYDKQALILVGNTLTLENGGTVDLAPYLDNTDNQAVTDFSLSGTILTLTLEDGGTQTVDIAAASSDDQALTLVGNTLTLEDGGTVDLAPYLDNTDNQQITDFSLAGTILTLTLEDGGTQTVDIAAASSDDQALTLVGNTLTLEDGGTVDLAPYLDNTDNQQITDFSLAGTILTLTLEDGGTQTVDIAAVNSGDNLGNHIATQDLELGRFNINGSSATSLNLYGTSAVGQGGGVYATANAGQVAGYGLYNAYNIRINNTQTAWVKNRGSFPSYLFSLNYHKGGFNWYSIPAGANDEEYTDIDQFNIMKLDKNGRLGIGTSSPTEKLEVDGSSIFSGIVSSSEFNATAKLPTGNLFLSYNSLSSPIFNVYTSNNSGNLAIYDNNNDVYFMSDGNVRQLRLGGAPYLGGKTLIVNGNTELQGELNITGDVDVGGNGKFSGKILAQEYSSEANIIMYLDSDNDGNNSIVVKDGAGNNKIIMSEEGQITASNIVATNTPNSKISTNWVELNNSALVAGEDYSEQLYSSSGRLKWVDAENVSHKLAYQDEINIGTSNNAANASWTTDSVIKLISNTTLSQDNAPVGSFRYIKNITLNSLTFSHSAILIEGQMVYNLIIPAGGVVLLFKETVGSNWLRLN